MITDEEIFKMPGIHAGFRRWYKKAPRNTRYLVRRMFDELVAELLSRGFILTKSGGANYLTLQKQQGEEWPVFEFKFSKRFRPYFWMDFSFLPLICKRMTKDALIDIPRSEADIVEGVVMFSIVNKKPYHPNDGYGFDALFYYLFTFKFIKILLFLFVPKAFINNQIHIAHNRLLEALEFIDKGMNAEWYGSPPKQLNDHIIKARSWADIKQCYQ